MKLVKFPFLDQLGECPIQADIEIDDALFEEGGETAGAYFVSSGVLEPSRLREMRILIAALSLLKIQNSQLGLCFGAFDGGKNCFFILRETQPSDCISDPLRYA